MLTPPEYVRYIEPPGLHPREFNAAARSPLPELMADMTGWREIADKLAEAYWSLSLKIGRKQEFLLGTMVKRAQSMYTGPTCLQRSAATRTIGTGGRGVTMDRS